MIFRYTKAFANTPPRPYLDVILRSGYQTTDKLMALVDSGADYPIFPMEIAVGQLRLDLTNAPTWLFSGTTGKAQIARLAEIGLTILGEDGGSHVFGEVNSTVAFCEDFKFSGGCLLGQNGFFSKFKTSFDQPKNYFELVPVE